MGDEPVADLAVDLSDEGVLTVRRAGEQDVLWKADPGCGEFHGSAYTRDGRRLITAMGDTTVLVWDFGGTGVPEPPALDEPMEKVWELLGSSNTWDVSRASATLVARGEEAVTWLRKRLSAPQPDAVSAEGVPALTWTSEGIARLRAIWALGRMGTPAARELLSGLASASDGGREARAARSVLESLK